MFDAMFPSHWSRIRKLYWLNKLKNNVATYEVVVGNPVSFTALRSAPLKSLLVSMSPQQDLHGYDAPWPAGGGKNLFDQDTVYASYKQTDGSFKGNGSSINAIKNYIPESLVGKALTLSAYFKIPDGSAITSLRVEALVDGALKSGNSINAGTYGLSSVTFTPVSTSDYFRLTYGSNGTTNETQYKDVQLELGSTATSFVPFANICPISGYEGVTVWDDPLYAGVIEWNQLVRFMDASHWELTAATGGFSDGVASVTSTSRYGRVSTKKGIGENMSLVAGHKYLYSASLYETTPTGSIYLQLRKNDESANIVDIVPTAKTGWETYSRVFTSEYSGDVYCRMIDARTEGYDEFKIKNVMLFDLTQMFGAGNEPATVAEFRELFPLDYYAYNAGTETTVGAVNGNSGTTISVTFPALGKNLYNPADDYYGQGKFWQTTNGAVVSNNDYYASPLIPVEPSTQYTRNAGATADLYFRADGSYIRPQSDGKTFTTPSDCYFVAFNIANSVDHNTVQLEKGATSTAFEPYTNTVYSGTLDVVSGVLTVTWAEKDLGDISWAKSNKNLFYGAIASSSELSPKGWSNDPTPNAKCEAYNAVQYQHVQEPQNGFNIATTTKYIYLYEETQTGLTKDEFKAAVAGVKLVYELATPIPIQLTPQEVLALVGENNCWSNADTVTVEYRSN